MDYLLQIIPTIADGLKVTVSLFFVVWILSIPGGILLALLRLSKLPLVDKIVEAFVYLMRGTPLMLQILFMYYALPIITDGAIQMDDATAAVITFVLNTPLIFVKSSAVVFSLFPVVNTKGRRFSALRMHKRCVPSYYRKCSSAFCLRWPMKPSTY